MSLKNEFASSVDGIVRPLVTVDVVIFTIGVSAQGQDGLQVLLVQRPAAAADPFPQTRDRQKDGQDFTTRNKKPAFLRVS